MESRVLPPTEPSASSPPAQLYSLTNTHFSAYLIAVCRRQYRGARMASSDEVVEYLFDDADCKAVQLVRDYRMGKAIASDPRTLFESQSSLKGEAACVWAGVANAKPVRR